MSEFWKRKIRTCFHKFDFDKDGVITKKDLTEIAIQFANFEGADKQKAENLKTQFENEWQQIIKTSETDGKEGVTLEEFIDSMEKQRYSPELTKHYHSQLHATFELMDVNNDGYLQADEYERLLVQMGVQDAPSFAKESFRAMDISGDGKLSFDELVNAHLDFLSSEDENSPYSLFFGPLVD